MAGQARVGELGPAAMAPLVAQVAWSDQGAMVDPKVQGTTRDQAVQVATVDPKVQGTTRGQAVQVATVDQSILVVQTAREEFAI